MNSNLQEKEVQLLQELVNLESKPKENNSDYTDSVPTYMIQATDFNEPRNYQGISTGEIGYSASNAEIEEYAVSKVYADDPIPEHNIGVPIDNPKLKLNPKYWEHYADKSNIRTAIYTAMPDQLVRPIKYPVRDQIPIFFNKGLSGLSSEAINKELINAPIRFTEIMKENREIYKNFI
jgi:hypothetical protein